MKKYETKLTKYLRRHSLAYVLLSSAIVLAFCASIIWLLAFNGAESAWKINNRDFWTGIPANVFVSFVALIAIFALRAFDGNYNLATFRMVIWCGFVFLLLWAWYFAIPFIVPLIIGGGAYLIYILKK